MKADGCNKIKCIKCKKLSCYLCGKGIEDYSHFCNHKLNADGKCVCGKTCRLWTSTEKMEAIDRVKRQEAGRKVLMENGYTDENEILSILQSPKGQKNESRIQDQSQNVVLQPNVNGIQNIDILAEDPAPPIHQPRPDGRGLFALEARLLQERVRRQNNQQQNNDPPGVIALQAMGYPNLIRQAGQQIAAEYPRANQPAAENVPFAFRPYGQNQDQAHAFNPERGILFGDIRPPRAAANRPMAENALNAFNFGNRAMPNQDQVNAPIGRQQGFVFGNPAAAARNAPFDFGYRARPNAAPAQRPNQDGGNAPVGGRQQGFVFATPRPPNAAANRTAAGNVPVLDFCDRARPNAAVAAQRPNNNRKDEPNIPKP